LFTLDSLFWCTGHSAAFFFTGEPVTHRLAFSRID
jgi:hypothetical protein